MPIYFRKLALYLLIFQFGFSLNQQASAQSLCEVAVKKAQYRSSAIAKTVAKKELQTIERIAVQTILDLVRNKEENYNYLKSWLHRSLEKQRQEPLAVAEHAAVAYLYR